MKMLTKELMREIPRLYSTEETPLAEKKIAVKFFDAWGSWTWFAFEGDPIDAEGNLIEIVDVLKGAIVPHDWRFFGAVKGFETELGYFSLRELESLKVAGGHPRIERDMYYGDKTVQQEPELSQYHADAV
jgi:hypothetical protein